jgi:membrane protein
VNSRDPFRFRAVSRLAERPVARSSVRMIQFIGLESQRSRLPQMAAALSYRTVFGLLPMIIVALVALRFFVSDAQIDQFVNRALAYAGLEAIVVEPPPPPTDESAFWDAPATASTPATADGEPPVVTPADVATSELAETIRSLIARAKSIDYRAIGLIGAITLIYAAISMLTEIERAFNQIFRVPIGKPWRRRMTEYWALLTLGTPCLVATFYVGERAKSIVERTVESAGFSSSGTVGIVLSGYAITVIISAALLLLAYTLLPNTRVRIVPAIAGALLAAILWEAGKWGFTQYLRYSTSYARLYGSIALIPLFLLWIYATWAIVLLGLHVTYHIQQARDNKNGSNAPPVAWAEPPSGVVDPSTAVAIVHAAARGFLAGTPASLTAIVEATRAQGSVVLDIVQRLVEQRILNRVAGADDQHSVSLAMPPERIKVRDVLEIGYDLAGPPPGPAQTHQPGAKGMSAASAGDLLEGVNPGVRARLRDSHLASTGSTTIADLLNSASTPLPLPPSNRGQIETSPASGANPYPPDAPADTLPADVQGEPDRDQKDHQNGVRDRDPAPRPGVDPGVL